MPEQKIVSFDSALPIEINVVSRSPHVLAYRFWSGAPGNWQIVPNGEGHTSDDKPDAFTLGPVPDGTCIAYWMGIGGNPNTTFNGLVTLGQSGRILDGGTCLETGKTNAEGFAFRKLQLRLEAIAE